MPRPLYIFIGYIVAIALIAGFSMGRIPHHESIREYVSSIEDGEL